MINLYYTVVSYKPVSRETGRSFVPVFWKEDAIRLQLPYSDKIGKITIKPG